MILNSDKKKELINNILEFLQNENLTLTAESLKTEVPNITPSTNNDLERKYAAVYKLQKKIFELEDDIEALKTELSLISAYKAKNIKQTENQYEFPEYKTTKILKSHKNSITSVSFHPVFPVLISSSLDGTIKIWDFESLSLEKTLTGHTLSVNSVNFSNNGELIVSGSSDQSIKIWNFNDKVCTKTLRGHDHSVSNAIFINETSIISCSRDGHIKLWDITTGYCLKSHNCEFWVRDIDFNNDMSWLTYGGNDQNIYLFDLEKFSVLEILYGHSHVIEFVKFVKNEDTKNLICEAKYNKLKEKADIIISGGRDKTLRIWNTKTLECILVLKGHDEWVKGFDFLHNNKFIISCGEDNSMKIWDLSSGIIIKDYKEIHNNFVNCIKMHPQFKLIVTGSSDLTLKLWDFV